MTTRHREAIRITISTAARRTGLSIHTVRECLTRELIVEPLSQTDLAELRRILRLRDLGVNMAGVEIILRMRQRIQALQTELDRRGRVRGWPGSIERWPPWQRLLPWESARD